MENAIENIHNTLLNTNEKLNTINNKLDNLEYKVNNIEIKINNIENKLNINIANECKKMGTYIDFIENIYENVKHPLGYINSKLKSFIGKETQYSLTNK